MYKADTEGGWLKATSFHVFGFFSTSFLSRKKKQKKTVLVLSALHLPAAAHHSVLLPVKVHVPASTFYFCGSNLFLLSHTAWRDYSVGTLWTAHFINLLLYGLEVLCFSNINLCVSSFFYLAPSSENRSSSHKEGNVLCEKRFIIIISL